MKRELTEVVITDQESSMDVWIDYLSSQDATYSDWLKYYALRGVLGLGDYDKEKHQFRKRSKGTTKPFPDLNREALAYVCDAIEKQYAHGYIDLESLAEHDQKQLKQLLDGANFGKLYAFALENITPASEEELSNVQGEWVKYDQGADHMSLVQSLQGHGTGWCTAGESTARTQLNAGDFYVFYSHDANGKPTVPRAAIRMEGNSIGEVRGIAKEQNLDPGVADVVAKKMAEFGSEGDAYRQKAADMQQLTQIEKQIQNGKSLERVDLMFLYELDRPIQGFGYEKDPRIAKLLNQRNPTEDAPIVFDCEPSEIAHTPEDITSNTKAYMGRLESGIFQKIAQFSNIEYIYTKFPEGKIQRYQIEVGGKTGEQLETELQENNILLGDYVKDLLRSNATSHPDKTNFEQFRLAEAEELKLVRLTVTDLGFPQGATTDEIYAEADTLGLVLCPPEVGPQLRLQLKDPVYISIAMKPILDRDGVPKVFYPYGDGIRTRLARSDFIWHPSSWLVFRLRK